VLWDARVLAAADMAVAVLSMTKVCFEAMYQIFFPFALPALQAQTERERESGIRIPG
jgi:hypothetical protein